MQPMRRTWLTVAALIVCLASVQGSYVHFDVLQAISGGTFAPAGSVSGELAENSQSVGKLSWDRPSVTESQKDSFAAAVKANKYVQIKIPSNPEEASSTPVVASVPARCLAGPSSNEELQLHLSPEGRITSVEYRANCGQPVAETSARDWSPPQEVSVISKLPETVQPLRVVHHPGSAPSGLTAVPQDDPGAQQGASDKTDGRPTPKAAPPPDNRSWFQKNWIFLIPAGMLLLNMLGGAADPAPARSGPAASVAAAPAGRARKGR